MIGLRNTWTYGKSTQIAERGERCLQLATDECEHRRLEARVVRRHERRRLHRVQPVVPVAAARLRRAVAALHSEVAVG